MARTVDTPAAPQHSAPRFAMGWAALTYAIATLTLAYPALAGGFLVNPRSDQFIAGYAFREFAAATLKAGQGFPQWNPYLFGGMPYIAAMHGDIFYPTFLLRMVLPTDVAMTWSFIIHLFLAGLFTFGFLRAWGVGFYGSLVGGLAYMMSGPIAGYASPGHDGKLYVSALLPLALWMLVRGVRDGRVWAWGCLSLTIALAVLSPHPQLLQYMLLVSGAFALFLAFGTHDVPATGAHTVTDPHFKLARDVALKRLGLALGAVLLGAVIGAVQYLPVREYVPWSPRAGGKGWEHAVSYSMPIEELFNAVVPQFSGILGNYWGRNGIHLHSEYAGVAVLILAGLGMFSPIVRRNARWFWLTTGVITLLWALGGYTPFYRIIFAIVPGTKFFRAPSTMMFVPMFTLAVFAGLGTERIVRAPETIRRRFVIAWGVATAVLVIAMIGGLPQAIADSISQTYNAPEIAERAAENQPHVILGALRSLLFAAIVLASIWFVWTGKLSRRAAAWTLLAVVGLDLWSIERLYWLFSPPAREIFAADPAIEVMKRATTPGRVVALDLLRNEAPFDRAFTGDVFMIHRVRSVLGYHGNEVGRYDIFEPRVDDDALARLLQPATWRHENVQWLYTTVPDSLIGQIAAQMKWSAVPTRVVGPVRNTAGSMVFLYKLPGENPAAWVASVMVKGSDDQALATVLNERFDPARAAIFDTAAAVQAVQPTTAPPPSGVQANVTRFDPGQIDVELAGNAVAGSALVVSENYFPGWRATVDGKAATTARANYNLIGVPLPAGAQKVQLRFVDEAYERGKTVSVVALLLAIAATVAGVMLDRRRLAVA